MKTKTNTHNLTTTQTALKAKCIKLMFMSIDMPEPRKIDFSRLPPKLPAKA